MRTVGVAVGVLWLAAVTLIELLSMGSGAHYLGLLAAAPLLVAVMARPRDTADIALLTLVAELSLAQLEHLPWSRAQLTHVWEVVLVGVVSVLAAQFRQQQDDRVRQLTKLADAVQRALLRPVPATVASVPVAVRYLSAFTLARVGGDLYEVAATEHGVRLLVGDVRGKGLPAVQLASTVLGSFREAAHREETLENVAAALDSAVAREAGPEDFVTAVLVELPCLSGSGPATFISRGHPLPIRIRDGQASEIELAAAPPLGFGPMSRPVQVELLGGDRVLLFTDGASEARRDDVFYPLVEGAEAAFAGRDLPDALLVLEGALHRWTRQRLNDDVALLAFEVPAGAADPAELSAEAEAPVPSLTAEGASARRGGIATLLAPARRSGPVRPSVRRLRRVAARTRHDCIWSDPD